MRLPLLALAVATAVGGLAACSSMPVRTGHPLDPQPELLSTSHWAVMANYTGVRLAQALGDSLPPDARLHVAGHASYTDFDRIFREDLAQTLRGHGYTVVPTQAEATHVVAFGTRVTDHAPSSQPAFGKLTALTAGLWGLAELAEVASVGATATAASAMAEVAVAGEMPRGLSEITVVVAVQGPQGAALTTERTYYVARNNAHNYPELALPAQYATPGRARPEPPMAHFIVE